MKFLAQRLLLHKLRCLPDEMPRMQGGKEESRRDGRMNQLSSNNHSRLWNYAEGSCGGTCQIPRDYSWRLQGAGRVYLSAIAVATLQLVGVVTIRAVTQRTRTFLGNASAVQARRRSVKGARASSSSGSTRRDVPADVSSPTERKRKGEGADSV